jgi:hypothetical protein
MTETEKLILESLSELDNAARSISRSGVKSDVGGILARLDSLTTQLPRDTDPKLLHYLHRKSYEKARLFLLGRESENARGTCGH